MFILTIAIVLIYFFFFHSDLMFKLGFSERDESVLFIGLYVAVVFNSLMKFIELLLIGQIDFMLLINVLIFMYFAKSRYHSL
jgi:hypothetical protein